MKGKLRQTALVLLTKHKQLVVYGIIGASCASLDFIIYTLLYKAGVSYFIANIIGIHCGIFCSFVLNRQYNFKVKDKILLRFLSFYGIGLVGLLLSSVLLFLMVDTYQWDAIISKIITIIVVAILQFCYNKLITFRKTKNNE